MEDQNKKKILSLRWTAIIVTSYIIIFVKGKISHIDLGHLLILVYILSNLLLTFIPHKWFSNLKFFYSLVLIDTGIVSFGMFLAEKVTTDFYLVFFFILIFASMSRNYKLLMIISGVTASLYGILLYSWGLLNSEQGISYIIRIPFIFIMAAFYGYIVQTFSKEKQRQLAISEDKYRVLFENANDVIIILRNSPWQIADVNREVEQLTGYKKAELLQKDALDLIAPPDREEALSFFEGVIKEGEGR